jgi:hypothetical protein
MDELTKTAAAIRRLDVRRAALIAARDKQIDAAREAGATWRSIALTLGMTEHGVIKSVQQRKGR